MKLPVYVSAVVYMHNQERTIEPYLQEFTNALRRSFEAFELILVDDASTDRTGDIAGGAVNDIGCQGALVRLARRHGREKAMLIGLTRSVGDFVFEFNAPALDIPPDLPVQLYRTSLTGFDIVEAVSSEPIPLSSRLLLGTVNRLMQVQLSQSTVLARLISRRALNSLVSLKGKVFWRKISYAYSGYAITSVCFQSVGLPQGEGVDETSVTHVLHTLLVFTNLGPKASVWLCVLFFIAFLVCTSFQLNGLATGHTVGAVLGIAGLICLGFALVFLLFGLLFESVRSMTTELRDHQSSAALSVKIYSEQGKALSAATVKPSA